MIRKSHSARALVLAALVVATLRLGVAGPAGALTFGPARRLAGLLGGSSIGLPYGTEPRIVVAPSGRTFVVTNDATGQPAVFGSPTWSATGAFPAALSPSPDVDIVATRTGRLVAAELDEIGFGVAVSYSDDSGKTWKASRLAALADQDRPWLAVGPDDPSTHRPRVYLLFHNLFSATGVQEMFVATSKDGGASFGLPVPLAAPGSEAFLDLQCGNSAGPSGIAVNRTTGRIYAVWGTRTSKLGGCGVQVWPGPIEFSIESPTRIWIATSPDGSAGSWRTSLAVDDSATGNEVGILFSPVAVDRAGNVYVAYPWTPHRYPNYEGGAIRYRWAPPGLTHWSPPVTVAPAGGPGHFSAHIVAGDPGKLDLAYFAGADRPGAPSGWYATVAQTLDGLSSTPHFTEVRLAGFPSYTGTETALAGSCGSGPAEGLQQGLLCTRAADNFGVALDAACRLVVAWPAVKTDGMAGRAGTWVSVQQGGPALC